ncbi:MAG TPA: serine protease, partial [Crinalium sp.]
MNLSLKQLATYVSLLAIGSGAGVLGSQYFLPHQQVELNPADVPAVLQPSPKPASQTAALAPYELNNGSSSANFIATAVERVGPAV